MLGDLFGFRLYYNSGAAFGLGTGITPVLTTFACVAVVAMLVALTRTTSRWWALAVGVLLGGAAGNLTDRLLRPPGVGRGEVVDFLELPSWPIFNVADMAVIAGAVSIVLLSFRNVEFGPATASDGRASEAAESAAPDEGPDHRTGTP